jgi:hypothetical protein
LIEMRLRRISIILDGISAPFLIKTRRKQGTLFAEIASAISDPCGARGSNSPLGCYSLPLAGAKSARKAFLLSDGKLSFVKKASSDRRSRSCG